MVDYTITYWQWHGQDGSTTEKLQISAPNVIIAIGKLLNETGIELEEIRSIEEVMDNGDER